MIWEPVPGFMTNIASGFIVSPRAQLLPGEMVKRPAPGEALAVPWRPGKSPSAGDRFPRLEADAACC